MSITVNEAFVKQYEADLKLAYQRRGSKLRNTVRLRTGVKGETVTFQKMGKGSAQTKARHADVPVMNAEHSPAVATMADYYAGDYVDKLDLLKTNIDERQGQIDTGAYACGRTLDDVIIDALDAGIGSTMIVSCPTTLTKANILSGIEKLNANDVPDDGNRYALVGHMEWTDLMGITEFASADYVGGDLPFKKGSYARSWLGCHWILHTGLNYQAASSNATRQCILYHKSALGLGEGMGITADITWHGTKSAWFINHMFSAGAIKIDGDGVAVWRVNQLSAHR